MTEKKWFDATNMDCRVLVIDDDIDFANSLGLVLGIKNYKTRLVHNEADALELIKTFDPQVALIDIRLGKTNGIDLIIKLKEIKSSIFCIMVTAYGSIDTAVLAMKKGAFDYLVKPFNPQELLLRVERCFEYTSLTNEKIKLENDVTEHIWDKVRLKVEKDTVENKLIEIDQQVNASFYQAAIGIGHLSIQGTWILANQKLCSILDYTQSEILQKNFREIIHPNDYKEASDILNSLITGDKIFCESMENRFLRKNGSFVWVNLNISVVRSSSGKPLYFIFSVEDINLRKKGEEKLQLYTSQLEEINQNLEDLSFSANHHLKEPLRKLIMFADHLNNSWGNEINEEGKQFLKKIQTEADLMQDLIFDLLEFSRLAAKRPVLKDVDLKEVVARVILEMESEIQQAKGKVSIISLPQIVADYEQMKVLFKNLISNALKFHREEVSPVVIIDSDFDPRGYWEISVKDNGLGFEKRHLEKIFKPFVGLFGKKEFRGTRMGLTLCQKIVQNHLGKINALSEPQKGSIFIITLPAN